MKNFEEVVAKTKKYSQKTVAVVEAQDTTVLEALKTASEKNLAKAILFGKKTQIEKAAKEVGFALDGLAIKETPDELTSAREACLAVRNEQADILMKGSIHSDDFLRAILDKETGLRANSYMSHVFILQREDKFVLISDGAMNISPALEDKAKVILNALHMARILEIEKPRVAVLAAVEVVNPDMPATVDAACLHGMSMRKQFSVDCIIEGPFALDNAMSVWAAEHKGIKGEVAGKADILIVPSIEAGNMLAKSFCYFAEGLLAGVLVGASAPIVLTSRADSDESKYYSIAVAVLMSDMQRDLKLKVGTVHY